MCGVSLNSEKVKLMTYIGLDLEDCKTINARTHISILIKSSAKICGNIIKNI